MALFIHEDTIETKVTLRQSLFNGAARRLYLTGLVGYQSIPILQVDTALPPLLVSLLPYETGNYTP